MQNQFSDGSAADSPAPSCPMLNELGAVISGETSCSVLILTDSIVLEIVSILSVLDPDGVSVILISRDWETM